MKEVSEETNCSGTKEAFPTGEIAPFVIAIGKVGLLFLGEIGYILLLYIIQNCILCKYSC